MGPSGGGGQYGGGGGGYGQYQPQGQSQGFGGYQSQSGYGQSQSGYGQSQSGYGAGAGGYNPQLMPGMGNDTQFQGGTPFWQPWPGWNEKTGTSPTAQGNMDQGAAQAPGAPAWLQHQLGDYRNLPMYTNPNQYGRFNWGTNMQGGGIPSPFGQYAQQFAQYNPLQFPPPPGPGGSGGPPPPPGGQPPPPPGQPPSGPMDERRMVQAAQAFGTGSTAYNNLLAKNGGDVNAMNQMIQKQLAGFQGGQSNMATPQEWGWRYQGGQWVPPKGDTSGESWDAATQRFK